MYCVWKFDKGWVKSGNSQSFESACSRALTLKIRYRYVSVLPEGFKPIDCSATNMYGK